MNVNGHKQYQNEQQTTQRECINKLCIFEHAVITTIKAFGTGMNIGSGATNLCIVYKCSLQKKPILSCQSLQMRISI